MRRNNDANWQYFEDSPHSLASTPRDSGDGLCCAEHLVHTVDVEVIVTVEIVWPVETTVEPPVV